MKQVKQGYAHGQYKVGDKIKAFDFQPIEGREDKYVVGEIKEIGRFCRRNVLSYKVKVEVDTLYGPSEYPDRKTVFVPLGLALGEFDERITKVN